MTEPNAAQLTTELIESADSQNPDPAIARQLMFRRLDIGKLNRDMQAANFAKQNGIYSDTSSSTSEWNGEYYALGAFAGLLLLAFLL